MLDVSEYAFKATVEAYENLNRWNRSIREKRDKIKRPVILDIVLVLKKHGFPTASLHNKTDRFIESLLGEEPKFKYGRCNCGRELVLKWLRPVCWVCKKTPLKCTCDRIGQI